MQNSTEFIALKTAVNWPFSMWCYLVFSCFDWKIDVFQQTVLRFYIIKSFRKLLTKLLFSKSFLEVPNTSKYSNTFKNYACSYTIEVLNSLDQASQPSITKTCVKNKLNGLLVEMKGFKFEIMLPVTLHKKTGNGQTNYSN